jgi:TadE-like protein
MRVKIHQAEKRHQRGVSMFETVVAIPILLFLGLAALQWMLVFQARYALTSALQDAARAGSVAFAQEQAIETGLARGLVPYLYGANDVGSFQANLIRAVGHIQFAKVLGFSRLRMLSPTSESFTDWARPARDAQGDIISGLQEIPNDNLAGLSSKQTPVNGSSSSRLSYAVGSSSKQSLSDANILKLELTYGIPLTVPFVGRITVAVLKTLNGCASSTPVDACTFYDSFDESGQPVARLPVLISSQVRMQTPARKSGYTAASVASPFAGEALGAGEVGTKSDFKTPTLPGINVGSSNNGAQSNLGPSKGANGFLQFGADRVIQVPGSCV